VKEKEMTSKEQVLYKMRVKFSYLILENSRIFFLCPCHSWHENSVEIGMRENKEK
jgi:hypothetical protein